MITLDELNDIKERTKRHTVNMLPWVGSGPMRVCPKCMSRVQFRHIRDRNYPGWECGHCHILIPEKTWMAEGDTFVKRYPEPKARNTYVDRDALSRTNKLKRGNDEPGYPQLIVMADEEDLTELEQYISEISEEL